MGPSGRLFFVNFASKTGQEASFLRHCRGWGKRRKVFRFASSIRADKLFGCPRRIRTESGFVENVRIHACLLAGQQDFIQESEQSLSRSIISVPKVGIELPVVRRCFSETFGCDSISLKGIVKHAGLSDRLGVS